MTITAEKRGSFFEGESDHTQDEALRGFDFHAVVDALGSKAVSATEQPKAVPDEYADEPHELYGFAD